MRGGKAVDGYEDFFKAAAVKAPYMG